MQLARKEVTKWSRISTDERFKPNNIYRIKLIYELTITQQDVLYGYYQLCTRFGIVVTSLPRSISDVNPWRSYG